MYCNAIYDFYQQSLLTIPVMVQGLVEDAVQYVMTKTSPRRTGSTFPAAVVFYFVFSNDLIHSAIFVSSAFGTCAIEGIRVAYPDQCSGLGF